MFNNFTGSSRKPRQVNLSQRNSNPFAKTNAWGSPSATTSTGAGNAIERAQQDRAARQQERVKKSAAALIQRTYRGHSARKTLKAEEAATWDNTERLSTSMVTDLGDPDIPSYGSEHESYDQLYRLLRFASPHNNEDVARVWHYYRRLRKTVDERSIACSSGTWLKALLSLQGICLDAIQSPSGSSHHAQLLEVVKSLAKASHFRAYEQAAKYYRSVEAALKKNAADLDLVTAPLLKISSATPIAYEGFTLLLQQPELSDLLERNHTSLDHLAENVNIKLLGNALAHLLRGPLFRQDKAEAAADSPNTTGWTSLLAHFIYFYRYAHDFRNTEKYASDPDFLFCVSTLISSLVDHIEVESQSNDYDTIGSSRSGAHSKELVPEFVRRQLYSLVDQGLSLKVTTDSSQVLASYILTLFRLFPRKGDEIRMWLYLSSSPSSSSTTKSPEGSSVVRYFFEAMQRTQIFSLVTEEPRLAVQLLKPDSSSSSRREVQAAENTRQNDIDDQWRVILIFLELYSFVLKVMDDEEFFASSNSSRKNVLSLDEIKTASTFLKHLGFTMYYNASDILGTQREEEEKNIASLFSVAHQDAQSIRQEQRRPAAHVGGIQGMSLEYFKGLVTGVIRALYERDSRRPFCPAGHWLMTSRFDMTNFIDAVVEEEERRSKVQEEDEEDMDGENADDDDDYSSPRLIGTSHAQRVQRLQKLQRIQRKASRRRYLQAVAPRLEILQNMPFLIPFTTRVQIFRKFVHMDKLKRRHGHVDPEMWRAIQGSHFDPLDPSRNPLARHHANIRRGREFEDAFKQYYGLGDNLKEPIQITFYNQFGEPEAGIDGGGVTKEFLTSVTDQVFSSTEGVPLFAENDQHLLYPNPSALDEQQELMKGMPKPNDPNAVPPSKLMLQQYEFLGRVIGKCLYESILVDIRFAPFFLLKWALTGGNGSAPNESGYRANLNDLRDLDEGLYQGLLQLKNYTGDVEDFSLNFTITDTIKVPATRGRPAREMNITRDLKPGGSDEPVTQSNRLVYISFVARHRLSVQPRSQTMAFLRGLSTMVQPSWLSMFNQSELQTLVGGAPAEIDVADLRRNTVYGGLYVIGDDGLEHDTVRLFWETMSELGDEDRRAVVKFVTSTPRAPLLGFKTLAPHFSIRDSGDDDKRLPSTSTCVNLLKLPRYKDKGTLKNKLLQAVRSGAGFDLS